MRTFPSEIINVYGLSFKILQILAVIMLLSMQLFLTVTRRSVYFSLKSFNTLPSQLSPRMVQEYSLPTKSNISVYFISCSTER